MKRAATGRTAAVFLTACLLIAASYAAYKPHALMPAPDAPFAFKEDPAEYRFSAEHFWGIPHAYSTYIGGEQLGWWKNLSNMPYRGIGVGTYYQLVAGAHRVVTGVDASPDALAGWYRVSQQLLLAGAYLFFFLCCRRIYGTRIGLACLALLLVQWQLWRITEGVMTEPLLRILLVTLAGVLVAANADIGRRWKPAAAAGFALLLACVLVKHQMLVFLGVLACALALRLRWEHLLTVRRAACIAAATLAIPACLLAVNVIGWGYPSFAAGAAVHADLKTNGAFLRSVCGDAEKRAALPPQYCAPSGDGVQLWGMFVPSSTSTRQFLAIDGMAVRFILSRPLSVLHDLASGLWYASAFPPDTPPFVASADHHQTAAILILDMLTWLVLLAGLARKRTALLSLAGIGMWLVPAVGNVFAIYVPRYERPMAALPLALAVIIAVELWGPWMRDTVASMKKKGVKQAAAPVGKALIAAFCLWQMFAVAVWALPFSDRRTVPAWIRSHLKPVVDPYIYATNQWQRWHMFVPEGPVYDSRYVIELAASGIHHPAVLLSSEQAAVFQGDDAAAKQAQLQASCTRLGLPRGMPVWFSQRDYVDPPAGRLATPASAMDWSLEWYQYYRKSFICP